MWRKNQLYDFMEGRSIYSNEMKNLLKQYQGFLTEIDKQSKVEERKIFRI